ncbi:AcrR [Brucella intermedia LMG 3301]|uniref:AcrR n=1 Tax=Brucella intermedia LMG 3301 TaxID=641118 RepID=C4WJ52_9HYPH|nr:AcrR [Brucella intermedia LMG 3301]
MARTKSVPDEAVLDRLLAVVAKAGPDGLTFARAAKAAGLSAATLVQRYGNSQSMLEAVLLRAWDKLDAATRAADEDAEPGPQGAIDLLMALMPSDAAEYNATDGLLLLREDIRNPVLRGAGRSMGRLSGRCARATSFQRCGKSRTSRLADGQHLAGRPYLVGFHALRASGDRNPPCPHGVAGGGDTFLNSVVRSCPAL